MYRLYAPRAKVHVVLAHHRHDNFFHDPIHVLAIAPMGLSLFSQQLHRKWQVNGTAFSLLGLYLGVEFESLKTKSDRLLVQRVIIILPLVKSL